MLGVRRASAALAWIVRPPPLSGELPRLPVLVMEEAVGARAVREPLVLAIPSQVLMHLERDIGDDGRRRGAVRRFDLAVRRGSALHTVEEVPYVPASVGRSVGMSGIGCRLEGLAKCCPPPLVFVQRAAAQIRHLSLALGHDLPPVEVGIGSLLR